MEAIKPAQSRKKKTNETGQPFRHRGAPSGPAVGYASNGTQMLKEYPKDIMAPYIGVSIVSMSIRLDRLTMMRARSSASSRHMMLMVEYKIGLKHPAAPRRYHATNLFFISKAFSIKSGSDLLQCGGNVPNDHAQGGKETAYRCDGINDPFGIDRCQCRP